MTKKRALVTGASGFIGSNLVKYLLSEGWDVSAIVRPNSSMDLLTETIEEVELLEFDKSIDCLIEIVGKSEPDVVFHLAALVLSDHKPNELVTLIESNILFGAHLLEAMSLHGVSNIVNTGTYWEHFQNKPYCPVNLYSATKHAFQDLLQYYVEVKGINAISLKLFDTYGPNDPRNKLLNLLINAANTGETLMMTPGKQKIDLVHINDVVNAYIVAAKRLLEGHVEHHEVYGVGSGNPISLKELVALLEEQFGQSLNIEWGGREYRPREVMKPWDQYNTLPGWNPVYSIKNVVKLFSASLEMNIYNVSE